MIWGVYDMDISLAIDVEICQRNGSDIICTLGEKCKLVLWLSTLCEKTSDALWRKRYNML